MRSHTELLGVRTLTKEFFEDTIQPITGMEVGATPRSSLRGQGTHVLAVVSINLS